MGLRLTTMNENDRAATGPRRSLAVYGGPFFRRVIMGLRLTTMNENDRAATGPRRSLAPYGGPIFRRGAERTEEKQERKARKGF